MLREWKISKGDKALAASISENHGIPRFAAHLLIARGIKGDDEIEDFLTQDAPLCDPLRFADMEKAVVRITKAINSGELIAVFGDYDVDGITATALLYSYLESCEANVMYMLPSRMEDGYGLRMSTVDKLSECGAKLIVTVDNGISSYDEVEYAKALGIDVVVTDHHQPPDKLPDACAVVDPHRADCRGKYKYFAGVGVAFKLVCALDGDSEIVLENYADLVALGTIADVVPLTGENRRLVRYGLDRMSKFDRQGILSLAITANIGLRRYRTNDISFTLAPRINAAGRIGKPDRAVSLMLSEEKEECDRIAAELCRDNSRRLEIERSISAQAWSSFDADPKQLLDKVVIIVGQNWNRGVTGIFASRMCETLGKPCFVFSVENGVAIGSGRSVEGFSLYEALCACSEKLIHFGGHDMAAGLTLNEEDIEYFRQQINSYASALENMPIPQLEIDCILPPKMVNVSLYRDSMFLEPFGAKNAAPIIGMTDCEIINIRSVGEGGKHQKITMKKDGIQFGVMYFRMPAENLGYGVGDKVDCAVSLEYNESYASQAGEEAALTRVVRDMRLSGLDVRRMVKEERVFESAMTGEILSEDEKKLITPSREHFTTVYRFVASNGYRGPLENMWGKIRSCGIGYGMMLTALEAMREKELLSIRRRSNVYSIIPARMPTKVDLNDSEIMQNLLSKN